MRTPLAVCPDTSLHHHSNYSAALCSLGVDGDLHVLSPPTFFFGMNICIFQWTSPIFSNNLISLSTCNRFLYFLWLACAASLALAMYASKGEIVWDHVCGHGTDLCEMKEGLALARSWRCRISVCALLCLDNLSVLASVVSYLTSFHSSFPLSSWSKCLWIIKLNTAVDCHLCKYEVLQVYSALHLKNSQVVTFGAHGTSDLPMQLEHPSPSQ